MRPMTTRSESSAISRLPQPWMVQSLPIESEGGLAFRRVVVQGHDKDSVDNGPERRQDEPVDDRIDGPGDAACVARDSPCERDEPEREEEQEHDAGAEHTLLMGAPSLPEHRPTSAERLERTDALDDHRRKDEQRRDGPSVPEDPRDEAPPTLVSEGCEPEEHADRRRQEGPDEDPEETGGGRVDAIHDIRSGSLEAYVGRADDRGHEVRR